MEKKSLIIYIPVIHKGYLEFLKKMRNGSFNMYIIDEKFLNKLYEFKPDIAALKTETVKDLLAKIGFDNVQILTEEKIEDLNDENIILVNDEISRNLAEKYFKDKKIEWESVFLRWDRNKVLVQENLKNITD